MQQYNVRYEIRILKYMNAKILYFYIQGAQKI